MAWVYKSWLESYHDDGVDLRGARMSLYSALMTRRMQRIVEGSTVLVAVEPDDTDHLFGFVVGELSASIPTIHFAYTKATRREHGIAGLLVRSLLSRLGAAPGTEWHFSHATTLGKHIAQRVNHGGRHNAISAWREAG
jgi:hypothetical protein